MDLMRCAVEQAHAAAAIDEVPVGAIVAVAGEVVALAHNESRSLNDPTAHAEILALRRAAVVCGNYRLSGFGDAVLYVTLEPCAMCFGAAIHARVSRLVFGAADPKSGVLGGTVDLRGIKAFNHRPEVTEGVLAGECASVLHAFFEQRRLRQAGGEFSRAVLSAEKREKCLWLSRNR